MVDWIPRLAAQYRQHPIVSLDWIGGSFASVGSIGSALSVFSASSWLSVGSVMSARSRGGVMDARRSEPRRARTQGIAVTVLTAVLLYYVRRDHN